MKYQASIAEQCQTMLPVGVFCVGGISWLWAVTELAGFGFGLSYPCCFDSRGRLLPQWPMTPKQTHCVKPRLCLAPRGDTLVNDCV